jgi:hypothetical protein
VQERPPPRSLLIQKFRNRGKPHKKALYFGEVCSLAALVIAFPASVSKTSLFCDICDGALPSQTNTFGLHCGV